MKPVRSSSVIHAVATDPMKDFNAVRVDLGDDVARV